MTARRNRGVLLFLIAVVGLGWSSEANAQEMFKVSIPLGLNEQYEQSIGYVINFDGSSTSTIHQGQAPGGILISIEKVEGKNPTYRIKVDSDGDGHLNNDEAQTLLPESSIIVRVNRQWKTGKRQLPYTIKHSRYINNKNETQESFFWVPLYRAEGKIKVKDCETLFVVLDLNGDGIFERRDFTRGTSIGLDRNGDGKIWGQDEWIKGEEIINFCGAAFLVDTLEADVSRITLVETSLRVPQIGEPLPAFSLTTIDGETLKLEEPKKKIYLLDFWASWCSPCIEKFASVKELDKEFGDQLATIAINVDEFARLPDVRQVIQRFQLTWPHVMSGRGEADPLWKMFGGMEGNRLAIPLYVLIDQKGTLRYAGNGGKDLLELRSRIQELSKENSPR